MMKIIKKLLSVGLTALLMLGNNVSWVTCLKRLMAVVHQAQ